MKKLFVVLLALMLVMGILTNGVLADELLPEEQGDEAEYMAAPAVAGILLEAAGVDNRYGKGRNGGNYIKDIANHMGPGTDFNGVSKEDVLAYECAIAAFLNDPGNGDYYPAGVTCSGCGVIDPETSRVEFETTGALEGTLTITVLDLCGNGVEGLGIGDIGIDLPSLGVIKTLSVLDAESYWTMLFNEMGNGIYEVSITRDRGTIPYGRTWGVLADGVDIGSAEVLFTYTTATYEIDLYVNGNPAYAHEFTFVYNRTTGAVAGEGLSILQGWDEEVDTIDLVNNYAYYGILKFRAEYPNGYVWYPAFTMEYDGSLTFIDGYGTDNVNDATGTWTVVYD